MKPLNVEGKAVEFRDDIYKLHTKYTIGVNDGKEFREATFTPIVYFVCSLYISSLKSTALPSTLRDFMLPP